MVYKLALDEFHEWSGSRGFSPDFLEKQLPSHKNKEVESYSAADYYENFKWARYIGTLIIRQLPLHVQLADIQERLAKNPDKRLGTIAILYGDPDQPMKIIDVDAENQPDEGEEVELLGYRFKLMDNEG